MDYAIAWEIVNSGGATGPDSIRVGDMTAITDGLHEWNGKERKKYGVAKITDVSDVGHKRLHERVQKVKLTKDLKDGYVLVDFDDMEEHFPHRFQLRLDELKIQFPTDAKLIDDLYDDKVCVATDDVPEWPWVEVKACFYDRVQGEKITDIEEATTVTAGAKS